MSVIRNTIFIINLRFFWGGGSPWYLSKFKFKIYLFLFCGYFLNFNMHEDLVRIQVLIKGVCVRFW